MKLVLLSGSVRDDRQSHGAVLYIAQRMKEQFSLNVEVVDLKEYALPPLTNTLHDDSPENVKKLGKILDEADGILLASPEYNGSFSSALKNAIDFFPKSTYQKKPIGVISISAGPLGGIRAAQAMQLQVLALMAYPIYRMMTVANVQNQVDTEGIILNPDFEDAVDIFVEEYLWLAEAIVEKKKG
ncbi:NADPH-dependent FMN reductase [Flammeovirga sp. EKP202]|uniref:NADPH-dependent FMN reductase n=1 Tax=Flammeovirga sp. EKP202 TaxID=2770592 RepID=UPI00165F6B25|nr:NAD(P)H-dependent oxidoreductase [Flammeovirga sp. EKP202]MBD0399914.1 NAD(P)H-dependent oxidoreductase [Flammeovirga sp. EKP202]